MTESVHPAVRPARPFFSSGPCAKRPGWSPEALKGALVIASSVGLLAMTMVGTVEGAIAILLAYIVASAALHRWLASRQRRFTYRFVFLPETIGSIAWLARDPEGMKRAGWIAFAVIAMTLTLAAVYAPIAFTPGRTGRLFLEFAVTLAGAVVVSGFVALTLTPMLCSKFLRHEHGGHSALYIKIERGFQALVHARATLCLLPLAGTVAQDLDEALLLALDEKRHHHAGGEEALTPRGRNV